MDNYAVIADISSLMMTRLTRSCVPEPIASADKIGLGTLSNHMDYAICLCLYDISVMDRGLFPAATLPLCLRYMVTASSTALADAKALEEARILGKAIAVFANNPVISANEMNNCGIPVSILADPIGLEDRLKIRTNLNIHKPVLFYQVSPVLIRLDSQAVPTRVRSTM